jgi:putative ABC transport system permease protein
VGHSFKVPQAVAQPPYLLTSPSYQGPILIVGVVGDKLDNGLSKPIDPEIFVPYTMAMGMYTQLLVRSEVPPLTLLHAVRAKVNTIDHDQQTNGDVRDLEHWISRTPEWARGQLIAWLFGAFAALALALAAVGLFSVVSYTVAQRTNEFGIRVALGAKRRDVLGLVFRSTAVSVSAGIVAGIALTIALNRVLASWDAESSRNPLLLLFSACVLALVATLACALPAWRASEVNPMTAIRYE